MARTWRSSTRACPARASRPRCNAVFAVQESNQFGFERNALLFKPGTYAVDANIGFNTQIAGLGFSPDDVVINGYVRAEADWFGDNGTQNFWRSAENMSVTPPDGNNRWAVSQAAPFRRMHVRGQLQLDPRGHGWSSGGFIADSKVDGQVFSGSQQQYMTRSSQIGSWSNGVWNMVFAGVIGAPAQTFPNPPYTVDWPGAGHPREAVPLYQLCWQLLCVCASATQQHQRHHLGWGDAGGHLAADQPVLYRRRAQPPPTSTPRSRRARTCWSRRASTTWIRPSTSRGPTQWCCMGLATLIPDNGIVAMKVADVDGVKVAGILFDAGTTNSPILLEVGPPGSSASHAVNPTSLHDVFARIGGAVAGKATVSLTINSSNVIVDHTWLWRGDHGSGIGWTVNTADTGLIVNGNNVTAYGLFVEHYQKYNVVWAGNGGRTYMFQNELPYDPPNQASWMNGTGKGYAAYKVANSVTTHEAWGVGSYCYFNVNPSVIAGPRLRGA